MKNTLNKLNKVFMLTFVLLGLSACTDLEIEETDSIISDGFQGLEDASSTVDNLYNTVTGQFGDQANRYALAEVTTDAFLIPTRGTDWGDNGRWRKLHQHEWGVEETDILTPFNQFNSNQLVASQILDSRSNPSSQNIGDASFLRAFSMWTILDFFGQVPFRDTTLPSSSVPTVLTGEDAVNFILADLDTAIANLPDVGAGSGDALNRGSKASARFLKAKVLLNKHVYINQLSDSNVDANPADMTEVVNLVDAIIADGFALESGYFNIFRDAPDTETIWSLQAAIGNRIFNTLHYNSTSLAGGGWNGFSTLAEFYDLFEGDANNNRLDAAGNPIDGQEERRGGVPPGGRAFTNADQTTNDGGFEAGSNVGNGFLLGQQYGLDGTPLEDRAGAPLAFTREFTDGTGSPSLINNNEVTGIRVIKYSPAFGEFRSHQILFRYADAHLMKAEAIMRGGTSSDTALDLVNQVRTIRGVAPFGSLTMENLADERGRELFGETWRRNDMIRFGQYLRQWEFKGSGSVNNEKYLLFPLPAPQLLANPNLVQNPGY
jgi:hypothetical protein